jgi:hypothetical protein
LRLFSLLFRSCCSTLLFRFHWCPLILVSFLFLAEANKCCYSRHLSPHCILLWSLGGTWDRVGVLMALGIKVWRGRGRSPVGSPSLESCGTRVRVWQGRGRSLVTKLKILETESPAEENPSTLIIVSTLLHKFTVTSYFIIFKSS